MNLLHNRLELLVLLPLPHTSWGYRSVPPCPGRHCLCWRQGLTSAWSSLGKPGCSEQPETCSVYASQACAPPRLATFIIFITFIYLCVYMHAFSVMCLSHVHMCVANMCAYAHRSLKLSWDFPPTLLRDLAETLAHRVDQSQPVSSSRELLSAFQVLELTAAAAMLA